MRAKLVVVSVEPAEFDGKKHNETVSFRGVSASQYPEDGSDENNSFSLWSPSVGLNIVITNPNLWGKLKVGQEYYSDFTLAKDVEPAFKRYQSHKVVEAIPIHGITPSPQVAVLLDPAIGELAVRRTLDVPDRVYGAVVDDYKRGNGEWEPGYLVRYADGYLSYSPKKAFEEGYKEIL